MESEIENRHMDDVWEIAEDVTNKTNETTIMDFCLEIENLRVKLNKTRIALADAIRRPMGVIPDSAHGLITIPEIDAAEKRRPSI